MPLPPRPDLPLLEQQEAQVAIIKAHQLVLDQEIAQLRKMVETANQALSPEPLAAWSTYLYWLGDDKINLGWLALATVGSPDYQSLKGHFAPITTGIDCALCHTPFTYKTQGAFRLHQQQIERGEKLYCLACDPDSNHRR